MMRKTVNFNIIKQDKKEMRTARRALVDIKENFIDKISKGNKSCLENIPKGSPREHRINS
jgi:hypothetical protein